MKYLTQIVKDFKVSDDVISSDMSDKEISKVYDSTFSDSVSSVVVVKKHRHTIVHWFAGASYRALKVIIVKFKAVCPFCRKEMKPCEYVGSRVIDKSRRTSYFRPVSFGWFSLFEDGKRVWVDAPKRQPFWFMSTKGLDLYG